MSIFLAVKVCDLVGVQRRNAGRRRQNKDLRSNKIRKNAMSIFLAVKVCDLVGVQRRNAGRRRQKK